MRWILCLLVIIAGCEDLTRLPEMDSTTAPIAAGQGASAGPGVRVLVDEPRQCGSGVTLADGRCRPLVVPERSRIVDTQQFHRDTRAAAARQNELIDLRNRQTEIRQNPRLAHPGERRQLERDRIRLEQDSLRAQRDRLRNAPYGRTIGGIDY